MSTGGKGGSQTTSVEIPEWMDRAAQRNVSRAENISRIGYTPYYGPDVAAFTPMQTASFNNTTDMAHAFGMHGGNNAYPQAQDFGGGVMGYSSAPLYERALQELQTRRPGQWDRIQSVFDAPQSAAPAAPAQQPAAQAPVANNQGEVQGSQFWSTLPPGPVRDYYEQQWLGRRA